MPFLNQRAYPSLARHFPPAELKNSPYFSPALGAPGAFAYLARPKGLDADMDADGADEDRQREKTHRDGAGCRVWIQYGSVENLRPDIDRLVEHMRADGVDVDVDLVEGGVHLDAGMAFALKERGEDSSWARFLEAVRTYA